MNSSRIIFSVTAKAFFLLLLVSFYDGPIESAEIAFIDDESQVLYLYPSHAERNLNFSDLRDGKDLQLNGRRGSVDIQCAEKSRIMPYRERIHTFAGYYPSSDIGNQTVETMRAKHRVPSDKEIKDVLGSYGMPCQLKRTLVIHGPITLGDSVRLRTALNRIKKDFKANSQNYFAIAGGEKVDQYIISTQSKRSYVARPFVLEVQISSPGGIYQEGLKMANRLREFARNENIFLITSVVGQGAWSAGAMLWSVGDLKMILPGTSVGFHAPYTASDRKIANSVLPEMLNFFDENLAGLSNEANELEDFHEVLSYYLPVFFQEQGPDGFIQVVDNRTGDSSETFGADLKFENVRLNTQSLESIILWLERDFFTSWLDVFLPYQYTSPGGKGSYFTPISAHPIIFWTPEGHERKKALIDQSDHIFGDRELLFEHLLQSRRTHYELWHWNHKEVLPIVEKSYTLNSSSRTLEEATQSRLHGGYILFREFISRETGRSLVRKGYVPL